MKKRKRSKANRFLPEYVDRYKDRHGTWRYRFRRTGYPGGHFKSAFGTDEFRKEYARFNSPESIAEAKGDAAASRYPGGSIGMARFRYYAVPERLGPTETTQDKVRKVLDRGFFKGRETWPLEDIRFEHIDAIIAKRRKKTTELVDGREKPRAVGGIEAARKLRKELVRFFDFCEAAELIERSPMKHVQPVKVAPAERSTGFYTWTEDDIAAYRACHPLGSKARLAMELILWTDQRKCDALHLGPQHVKGGKFVIRQSKTGKLLVLSIAAPLADAISAMPRTDALCFLMTEWGKPYSVKGFGAKMRGWCDEAGLPRCTAHGLRKATMRRMAELEMPNKTMKSVSGHSKDEEVARYTEAANQERLADGAIARLVEWEMSNLGPRVDKQSA